MADVKEGHGNHVVKRGFKSKTMVYTIDRKIRTWLKTLPTDLAKEIEEHLVLTGGAITSMLLGDLPNDYDIYFDNVETAKKVATHYLKSVKSINEKVGTIKVIAEDNRVKIFIKSVGVARGEDDSFEDYRFFEGEPDPMKLVKYFEPKEWEKNKDHFVPININTNAITLTDDIQIILRFIGKPEEIHRSFDFVHATNYYTKSGGIVFNPEALEYTLSKELKYIGSLYPICSVFRIKKFIERGWTITAGEMLKIAYDISKLNLDDPKILEDQLVGVDAAYFHQILYAIKQENKPIERTYLFELINRIFDEADLPDIDLEKEE